MPPAPLLLSITTDWPSRLATDTAKDRAKLSLGPPAGKGNTQVTVFSGQSPARAVDAASPTKPANAVRRRKPIIAPRPEAPACSPCRHRSSLSGRADGRAGLGRSDR